jgi:hypothetical protein
MKVLVACEESQAVTKRLRALGHEAYSCDIMECSGGKPEWHLMQDVTELLKEKWDMIIAFPPCTDISVSGAAWFKQKREDGRQRKAIEFFMKFINADCEKIAVENPVNIIGGEYIKKHFPDLCEKYNFKKSDQRIEPWQFGDEAQKKTCLWLKNLPKLKPTKIVSKGDFIENKRKDGTTEKRASWFKQGEAWKLTPEERSRIRSKTFDGIADAMATQWTQEYATEIGGFLHCG